MRQHELLDAVATLIDELGGRTTMRGDTCIAATFPGGAIATVTVAVTEEAEDDPDDDAEFGPCPEYGCDGVMNGGGYCSRPGCVAAKDNAEE